MVLSLAFAFVQLRLLRIAMAGVFARSSDVTEGVVHGVVAWRIYQSRVLGPYAIEALKGIAGSFGSAFDLVATAALAVAGYAILALTERLHDRRRPPLAAFLLLQMTFVLLVISNWIYPWDVLSIVFFVVFNDLVLAERGPGAFAALFAVAVLNHEIALFIAVWLILDPIVRYAARRRAGVAGAPFARRTALIGVGLLAAGIAVIEGLRRALLVRETLSASTLPGLSIYGRNIHFTFFQNWDVTVQAFGAGLAAGNPALVPLFLVAVVALAIQLARSDWTRCGALALVTVGMVLAVVLFGDIYESRCLMPLIPFLAMNGWQAIAPRGARD